MACPLTNTFPGCVAVAQIHPRVAQPITLASVYGVIDVYSQTTLLRIVADLVPLLDSVHGKRVILGGDFNMGTDTTQRPELARYRAILGAVEVLGLVNLYESVDDRPAVPEDCRCRSAGCRHLQTFSRGGQLDYLFASPEIARQCRRIERLDDPATAALSDHFPIVAEFGLTTAASKRRWDVEAFGEELGRRHGASVARGFAAIVEWAERKERALREDADQRWTLTRFPIPDAVDPECWLQLDRSDGALQYTSCCLVLDETVNPDVRRCRVQAGHRGVAERLSVDDAAPDQADQPAR